ncbi:hypothetical protein [Halobellus inordinatus]|uniref:hypothetical protein n=1 Tax=Halobellus inordinatus TaxID=1126236 RepID=UPI0021149284|nr:hypothetical protein [Halobellus ramosii]
MPEQSDPDQPEEATAEETRTGHTDQPDDPRWFRALVWLVVRGKYLLGAAALVVFAVLIATGTSVPRTVRIGTIAFIVSTFTVGRWTAAKTLDLIDGPGWVWLVDVDLLDLDGAGIYRWPRPRWKEVEVVDGQLYWSSPSLAFGKNVDLEANTVEGVWPGTLNDRELMIALSKVHELRNVLEEDAQRGFAIETQVFSIVRSATRQAVLSVVQTFEKSTLPDRGESINQAIDDAIEQFDLDRHIRDRDDDDPLDEFDGSDLDAAAQAAASNQTEAATDD